MNAREVSPGIGCNYTISADAKLPALMEDITGQLGAGAALFELLAADVADDESLESAAYWGGVCLLRLALETARAASSLVAQQAQQQGGAA